MNSNTEGFSREALQLLMHAREEASRLRHEYVGTEHVLLAFTVTHAGVATAAFDNLAVDRNRLRDTITSVLTPGRQAPMKDSELPYTSRTQTSFALAAESARELGHAEVTASDVMIGLLREGKNIAAQMLVDHGLTVERTIAEVRRLDALH